MRNEIKNCLGCGRDTRAESGYCFRCTGHSEMGCHADSQIDDRRGRRELKIGLDIEDDYGEESSPDSICV